MKGSLRRKSGSKKSGQEVNGNNQIGSKYKVENLRYNQRRNGYKSEDQNQERLAGVHGNYLQFHGQPLYPAVSEPAVCGYPVSMACPYDPVPIYSMYQPPPYLHRVPFKDTYHTPRRHTFRNTADNRDKVDNSKDTCQTVDEYTSLPPGNLQDIESDHQRRFSDPGLANNSGSEEEEDSLSNDKTSSESWLEDTSQLASQIESLVQENKRISKELKETQTELQELKLEFSSVYHMRSSCEPGFIADLVREVREATKLKEETVLAKFHAFSVDVRKECGKECQETKGLLNNIALEKEELSKRLAKLEEQMKVILAHNSIQDSTKDKLVESEKENLHLHQKLKVAVEAKGVAESNSNKYERLFSSMAKRLPNGLALEEKGASLETSESLSSDLSSGSPRHSPQVTMSGPVTDL